MVCLGLVKFEMPTGYPRRQLGILSSVEDKRLGLEVQT